MTNPPHPPVNPLDDSDDARVRRLLSDLPDPGPMPPDLVARITARLEEERHLGGNVVPFPSPARAPGPSRRFVLALGGAAAAAALVGAVGLQLVPGSSPDTVTAALRGAKPASGAIHAQVSSVRYTRADLARQAATLDAAAASSALAPLAAESPAIGPMGTPTGVRACASALGLDADGASVDLALYEGKPAAVVVTGQTGKREARVVNRSCGGGDTAVLAGPVALP